MCSLMPRTRSLLPKLTLTVLVATSARSMASLVSQVSSSPPHNAYWVFIHRVALKWFDKDGNESKYEGGRDLEALAE